MTNYFLERAADHALTAGRVLLCHVMSFQTSYSFSKGALPFNLIHLKVSLLITASTAQSVPLRLLWLCRRFVKSEKTTLMMASALWRHNA